MAVLSFVSLGLGAFSRSISDEQRAGTLEVLLATPTRLGVLLAGAFVVPLGITLLQVVVYVVAGVAFGVHVHAGGVAVAAVIVALLVLAFCAFGVFSAGFIVLTQRGDPFTLFATQATTFFAGAVFPVSLLPLPARGFARLVPAYYALDGLRRSLLTGATVSKVAGDVLVLTAFVVVLLPCSLAFLTWAVRMARRSGTLGTYCWVPTDGAAAPRAVGAGGRSRAAGGERRRRARAIRGRAPGGGTVVEPRARWRPRGGRRVAPGPRPCGRDLAREERAALGRVGQRLRRRPAGRRARRGGQGRSRRGALV
jgi:ABC-2 type transport system permease protein